MLHVAWGEGLVVEVYLTVGMTVAHAMEDGSYTVNLHLIELSLH